MRGGGRERPREANDMEGGRGGGSGELELSREEGEGRKSARWPFRGSHTGKADLGWLPWEAAQNPRSSRGSTERLKREEVVQEGLRS